MVLEVLPPVETSKGTAVRHLLAAHGLQRALYAGDDTTDLDGFAALDGLEFSVRVAVVSAEGPAALGARADVVVGSTGRWRASCELLDPASLEPEQLAHSARLPARDVELGPRRVVEHEPQPVRRRSLHRRDLRRG